MAIDTHLLLFDFGGVLVDWAGPAELGAYLRSPSTPEAILQRWIQCPHTEAFERGALAPEEWADRFISAWEVTLGRDEFLATFTMWSRRMLPGARELLDELRPLYRLAALSNSNALHWQRNTNELGLIQMFEFAISSHEVGVCKPDLEIFERAVARAGVAPEAIVFFDDLDANVRAARAAGLRAHQTRGPAAVREVLIRERLL
jgi:glucose-1-phosphatase